MYRPYMASTLLILFLGMTATTLEASNQSSATIVYDVGLREFHCWFEGDLTAPARTHPCDTSVGWHPMTGDLYFVRGEAVNILLVNAVAQDLFGLEVKADDLAEPATPISGALTELPKLLPIPPAPTVIPGPGTAFISGSSPIKPTGMYRLLSTAENKDFRSWVQSTLVNPLSAKEVLDFGSIDIKRAIEQLSGVAQLTDEVTAFQARVVAIQAPTTTAQLVDRVRTLSILLNSEAAFRDRLTATGVVASGKIVNDATTQLRSVPLRRALAIDSSDFLKFTSGFAVAFPSASRYGRIAAITISPDKNNFELRTGYSKDADGNPAEDMHDFLQTVTAAAIRPLTNDALKRLQNNLSSLSDMWEDVEVSQRRRQELEAASKDIEAQTAILQLQRDLNQLAGTTIAKAAELNNAGRTVALDTDLQILPVGQWFSSKTITVNLKQGQRVALFDIGGVSASTRASVTGGDIPAAKATQPAPSDLSLSRTLQFPIYNLYHFQLGLGFVYSTADDNRFQIDTVTTGSGSSETTQQFIDQTRSRDYTLLGTVNVIIFPWARTAFPWRARYLNEHKPSWYTDIGPMFGFSITSPSQDFFLGGSWFPRPSPVGVQVAWHIALRDYPPKGVDITMPLMGRSTTLQQRRIDGLAVGLVFTTDFFGKVFAPIFKP